VLPHDPDAAFGLLDDRVKRGAQRHAFRDDETHRGQLWGRLQGVTFARTEDANGAGMHRRRVAAREPREHHQHTRAIRFDGIRFQFDRVQGATAGEVRLFEAKHAVHERNGVLRMPGLEPRHHLVNRDVPLAGRPDPNGSYGAWVVGCDDARRHTARGEYGRERQSAGFGRGHRGGRQRDEGRLKWAGRAQQPKEQTGGEQLAHEPLRHRRDRIGA